MIWTELQKQLSSGETFVITSHLSPDGDCIGSQLAMLWYLELLGKKVTVYNHDPVPAKFAFLKNADRITTTKPTTRFDVLLVLDSSNLQRLGWDEAQGIADRIVNIDHHRDNALFGVCNAVEQSAATGELIYNFFTAIGAEFPLSVAEALYAAVLTDTGGFRFSNTNAGILRLCADLVSRGVQCAQLYENIYASHSYAGLLLQSRIWSTLTYHLNRRVCTLELPLELVEQLGAAPSDSEGMADHTITVNGVEVGMFIKHNAQKTHFSLRSKGRIDVGLAAKNLPGGGGHCNAAGCTIEENIEKALPLMLSILERELDGAGERTTVS